MIAESFSAPGLDLAELQACASRLAFTINILAEMERDPLKSGSPGVPLSRIKDVLTDMPLLTYQEYGAVLDGGMEAKASFWTGSNAQKDWADLSVNISCQPALGQVMFREAIRTDLSNAPGPADGPEMVVTSLRRLHALVAGEINRMKRDLVANRNPACNANQIVETNELTASALLSLALEEAGEQMEWVRANFEVTTSAPYGPTKALMKCDVDPEETERRFLQPAAEEALSSAFRPHVELSVDHLPTKVVYQFGPRRMDISPIRDSDDPIQALRNHAAAPTVEGPIWNPGAVRNLF